MEAPSETPISSEWVRKAKDMGVGVRDLRSMTPKERNIGWMRHRKALRRQAKAAGLDPDSFVLLTPEDRKLAIGNAPGHFKAAGEEPAPPDLTPPPEPTGIEQLLDATKPDEEQPEPDDPLSDRVYTDMDDNPADEPSRW